MKEHLKLDKLDKNSPIRKLMMTVLSQYESFQ